MPRIDADMLLLAAKHHAASMHWPPGELRITVTMEMDVLAYKMVISLTDLATGTGHTRMEFMAQDLGRLPLRDVDAIIKLLVERCRADINRMWHEVRYGADCRCT